MVFTISVASDTVVCNIAQHENNVVNTTESFNVNDLLEGLYKLIRYIIARKSYKNKAKITYWEIYICYRYAAPDEIIVSRIVYTVNINFLNGNKVGVMNRDFP
ncbi:MAG: hypothetical protein ACI9SY_000660 [Candidatus Paceibacteria bacterium]|jgi:hypothetical protein